MIGKGPIQVHHFPSPSPVLGGHYLTVLRAVPTGFKDRFMHGSATHLLTLGPRNVAINPLQSFVSTQQQATDIALDMLKSFCSTKDISVSLQESGNGLGNTHQRKHEDAPEN